MHYRCVFIMLISCVLVGLDWAESMMFLLLHVTCSCLFHAQVPFFFNLIDVLVIFCLSLSLSFFRLVALWHLSISLLRPGTLFVSGQHLLLPLLILPHLTFGSMMRSLVQTSWRTVHDIAFIQNAKSSCQIFLILTFPLSSIVGVGSHFVASRSLVPP